MGKINGKWKVERGKASSGNTVETSVDLSATIQRPFLPAADVMLSPAINKRNKNNFKHVKLL